MFRKQFDSIHKLIQNLDCKIDWLRVGILSRWQNDDKYEAIKYSMFMKSDKQHLLLNIQDFSSKFKVADHLIEASAFIKKIEEDRDKLHIPNDILKELYENYCEVVALYSEAYDNEWSIEWALNDEFKDLTVCLELEMI